MCRDGGQPVDDRPDSPLSSRGILVDNHGVPVPRTTAMGAAGGQGYKRGTTGRGCPGRQLLPAEGSVPLIHRPPVLYRYHRHSSIIRIGGNDEDHLLPRGAAERSLHRPGSRLVPQLPERALERPAHRAPGRPRHPGHRPEGRLRDQHPRRGGHRGHRDRVLRQAAEHRALAARGRRGDRAGRRVHAARAGPRRERSTSSCAASPRTSTPRSRRRPRSCTSTSPRRISSRWSRAPSSRCPTTRPGTS